MKKGRDKARGITRSFEAGESGCTTDLEDDTFIIERLN
jgi:hypothetical protein